MKKTELLAKQIIDFALIVNFINLYLKKLLKTMNKTYTQ